MSHFIHLLLSMRFLLLVSTLHTLIVARSVKLRQALWSSNLLLTEYAWNLNTLRKWLIGKWHHWISDCLKRHSSGGMSILLLFFWGGGGGGGGMGEWGTGHPQNPKRLLTSRIFKFNQNELCVYIAPLFVANKLVFMKFCIFKIWFQFYLPPFGFATPTQYQFDN